MEWVWELYQHVKTTYRRTPSSIIFVCFLLFIGGALSAFWVVDSTMKASKNLKGPAANTYPNKPLKQNENEVPLICPAGNIPSPTTKNHPFQDDERTNASKAPEDCPLHFRWIYEDLRPWMNSGISLEMVEQAKPYAHFRLVILNGRAYVKRYKKSFQTRDIFTIWGIQQLLRRYPGQLPDLDLMFFCGDRPLIDAHKYKGRQANTSVPPPLFGYCSSDHNIAIVFPDWSFWGWPEVNIKPWKSLLAELKEANEILKWLDRKPYAFWKGNPYVAPDRQDLLKCNVSDTQDWNARIYVQDWHSESQEGFKNSNLATQCKYRYKIYIEGATWSVSQKYILACDSMTLLIKPQYHDFFGRGLMPMRHYWPVRNDDKCSLIKYAVDWGNRHEKEAQAIGKAASVFIQKEVSMDYVYDYMLHLLNKYAKLLRYKPQIPQEATEICSELMTCPLRELDREFMLESVEKGPSLSKPCTLT